jgi:hypothetical protein
MIDMLATLMIHPLHVTRFQQMLMLLPLCLAISVVYKTIKCPKVRDIPLAALVSFVTIVVGMYAVGIGLFVIYKTMT